MTTEQNQPVRERTRTTVIRGSGSDAVYGLGIIGAWIYFIGHATTFWLGVLGFLKGIIWPTMLIYELLKYLQM